MLDRITSWAGEAALWGPLVPLIPIAMLALIEAVILPARLWSKGVWILMVVISCSFGVNVLQRQQQTSRAQIGSEADSQIAKLKGLWGQWDELTRSLPPAGAAPEGRFDTVDDAVASLSAKAGNVATQIAALREQLKEQFREQLQEQLKQQLSEQTRGRSIDADAAAKLAEYLRQFGANRVVVSCVPNDLEAYTYANQLITILTVAGWDARGPELTAAADATAMGVSLYVRDPRTADAAKILIDAFIRFNVPYQTGLAASDAIPDTATVELFVAKKP